MENEYDDANFSSNFSKLAKIKKRHKEVNSLLHIFSHKVQFDTIKNSSFSKKQKTEVNPKFDKSIFDLHGSSDFNSSFTPQKIHRSSNNITQSVSGGNRKESAFSMYEVEKIKLKYLKDSLSKSLVKKKVEARDMKDANRIMRENIDLLKDSIKEENQQKRKIVEAKYKLIKTSINGYQNLKKEYVQTQIVYDITTEMKEIAKKENELTFLRMEDERKNKIKSHNNTTTFHKKNSKSVFTGSNKSNIINKNFDMYSHLDKVNKIQETTIFQV